MTEITKSWIRKGTGTEQCRYLGRLPRNRCTVTKLQIKMTSYKSPNQSKLVMIWIAKHVDTNTVFPFRRNHITWMRNDGLAWTIKHRKTYKKYMTEQFIQFIYQEHLWHEWGTHQHPWPKISYFRAIVSWIIMSPVTWWVVCRVRTYEQYRCDVVVDSWFGFSAVMFFVTQNLSDVNVRWH